MNTLQEPAEVLQRQRTLGPLVASIAEAATVSVPGSDAAAIAISLSGRPSTAAITARVALDSTWCAVGARIMGPRAGGDLEPLQPLRRGRSLGRRSPGRPGSIAVSRSPEFVAARSVVEEARRNVEDDADVKLASGLLMINEACTAEQAEALLSQAAPPSLT